MDTKDVVLLKDIDGKHVVILHEVILDAITKGTVLLYGMTMDQIVEFKMQYETYGGKNPMTVESIKEFFERKGN